MIILSGVLVVVAIALLVTGIVGGEGDSAQVFGLDALMVIYISIGVSVASALCLLVGVILRRRELFGAAASAALANQARTRDTARDKGKKKGRKGKGESADGKDAGADADDDDDLDPQAARLAAVAQSAEVPTDAPVFVVRGRRRYHLETCRQLAGRDQEELTYAEAKEEGFTPCTACMPDTALAARASAPAVPVGGKADKAGDRSDDRSGDKGGADRPAPPTATDLRAEPAPTPAPAPAPRPVPQPAPTPEPVAPPAPPVQYQTAQPEPQPSPAPAHEPQGDPADPLAGLAAPPPPVTPAAPVHATPPPPPAPPVRPEPVEPAESYDSAPPSVWPLPEGPAPEAPIRPADPLNDPLSAFPLSEPPRPRVEREAAPTATPQDPLTPAAPVREPSVGEPRVRILSGTKRYHSVDCALIEDIGDDADDLETLSRSEAKARGCTPCLVCQPDLEHTSR